jgi:hypothetical protein
MLLRIAEFKIGAFKVAAEMDCSVVPITIIGTRDLLPAREVFLLDSAESPIVIINKEITAAEANHSPEKLRDLAHESIKASYDQYAGHKAA